MNEWSIIKDLITTVGFPIFISMFFIFKTQKILELLVEAVKSLERSIESMANETRSLASKVEENYALTRMLIDNKICTKDKMKKEE